MGHLNIDQREWPAHIVHSILSSSLVSGFSIKTIMTKKLPLSVFLLLCISQFTLLFGQEEIRQGTGLLFDAQSYRSIPYKAPVTMATYENLPTRFSLEKYCPTPGNQGKYSTCTAFAVAYHMRTILFAMENNITNQFNIDQNIFSPTFVYERIKNSGDEDCMGGSNPVNALELLKTIGVPSLRTFPYECGGVAGTAALLEATSYPIIDYQILYFNDVKDTDPIKVLSVKKSLSEGSPVVICFKVRESFYNPGLQWRQLDSDGGPTGQHGLHAMVVVGYDDARYGGSFRVMNSWGTGWGDKGYIWIPYADFGMNCFGALQAYGKRSVREVNKRDSKGQYASDLPALLEGDVTFQERNGSPMPASRVIKQKEQGENGVFSSYKLSKAYVSGTRFRFYLTANTQSYLYAFASDLTGEITTIFPFADGMSPLIGANSTIAFPSEKKVVRMDKQPGTDYLLMLYSDKPLDVDELKLTMVLNGGTFGEQVQQSLGDQLVPSEYIEYSEDGIGFRVMEKTSGSIVPLMIEIVHN